MIPAVKSGVLLVILGIGGCAPDQSAPTATETMRIPPTRLARTNDDDVKNPGMVWISPDELDQDFRAMKEPFEKVVKRLGDEVLSNFKCDHAALSAAGVKMDLPISVDVKKAKGALALQAILKRASEQTPGKPALVYIMSGYNTVLVTTTRELYTNWVYTRQYSMADLMMEPVQEREEALIHLIKETVDSDSWTAEGGKCAATYANRTLTVTQTHENLEVLDSLLRQLRETRPTPLENRLHPQGIWRPKSESTTKETK